MIDRRHPLADRHVDVVHQLAGVGQQQIDGLGSVDARTAADGDERIPRPAVAGIVDGGRQAGIGRFDVHIGEDAGLDAELSDLLCDALGNPSGRDALVGDHQHPPRAELTQLETDFADSTGTEFQLRCAVGEDRFGIRGKIRRHLDLLTTDGSSARPPRQSALRNGR